MIYVRIREVRVRYCASISHIWICRNDLDFVVALNFGGQDATLINTQHPLLWLDAKSDGKN